MACTKSNFLYYVRLISVDILVVVSLLERPQLYFAQLGYRIGNKIIEQVNSFKYLGHLISYENETDIDNKELSDFNRHYK
jgi:hypothetical protein